MSTVSVRIASLMCDCRDVDRYWAVIDDKEQARAGRFHDAADRRRFVVRRALRRLWLGDQLDTPPAALRFEENAFGKPSVPGGLHFSASHSGDVMMLAVADRDLGCDIERIDEALDWRAIAARFFAPAEVAALAALPDAEGQRAFFDCWARKEAFVKATGQGLSQPLDGFVVSVTPDARLLSGGDGWAMAPLAIPGFAGAIVTVDTGRPVTLAITDARADA